MTINKRCNIEYKKINPISNLLFNPVDGLVPVVVLVVCQFIKVDLIQIKSAPIFNHFFLQFVDGRQVLVGGRDQGVAAVEDVGPLVQKLQKLKVLSDVGAR